jgi:Ca-activated chloride channel family protein
LSFEFANKYSLLLLVLLVPLAWAYWRWVWKRRRSIRFSDLGTALRVNRHWSRYQPHIPFALRLLVLVLLIVAMARPRSGVTYEDISSEGIDIVLTMDVSSSMLAEDLKRGISRLEVAKKVVADFILRRKHDRIGLVAFAAKAITRCPPTLDYRILDSQIEQLQIGSIEDGTAIGVALASSANRLRNSKAKSRVIVLLTDGMNNRGEIDPLTAARVSEAQGLKVYTIGVGTRGMAPVPVKDAFGRTRYQQIPVEIDEKVLREIASMTGGKYYRAMDARELQNIYQQIDTLEKTKIEVREYKRFRELFALFLFPALGVFVLELFLAGTRFRTIP